MLRDNIADYIDYIIQILHNNYCIYGDDYQHTLCWQITKNIITDIFFEDDTTTYNNRYGTIPVMFIP